jgi:Zn ribbon nucleic-acid-binding protein
MKLTCSECDKHERIRVWDEQDGYATARLMGWVIGDGSICPQCAAKAVLVQ